MGAHAIHMIQVSLSWLGRDSGSFCTGGGQLGAALLLSGLAGVPLHRAVLSHTYHSSPNENSLLQEYNIIPNTYFFRKNKIRALWRKKQCNNNNKKNQQTPIFLHFLKILSVTEEEEDVHTCKITRSARGKRRVGNYTSFTLPGKFRMLTRAQEDRVAMYTSTKCSKPDLHHSKYLQYYYFVSVTKNVHSGVR